MLKNLLMMALLGVTTASVSVKACAKGTKVVNAPSKTTASSITCQVANQTVNVEFYSPSIVRVVKSVTPDAAKQKKSYSVILKPQQVKGVSRRDSGDTISMKSAFITVTFNKRTGEIAFLSKEGQPLLRDTKTTLDARHDAANKGKYRVRQCFRLADDEAVYGLGQLRDTHMSQRDRHVELWNHNTYIAIPYFTSEKGYGVY